ncbi:MAG TPA: hypothetical protein VGL56_19460 [Fimbriimonadaceae bacterium]|jgi:hypothetical protein
MEIRFEKLTVAEPRHEWVHATLTRAKVPGGWLVSVFWSSIQAGGTGLMFYPDPLHEWDGSSLPDDLDHPHRHDHAVKASVG